MDGRVLLVLKQHPNFRGAIFAVALVWVVVATTAARADTIVRYVDGDNTFTTGSAGFGQSVTIPSGTRWTGIGFTFYTYAPGSSTPVADASGSLYLLDRVYAGTPDSLSTSTPGYIAVATAASQVWTFDPSVTLQPNTKYYFYMGSEPPQTRAYGYAYDGGEVYYANGTFAYLPSDYDLQFSLTGSQSSPGPIPGSGLLSYLILGVGGAAAIRKRLRERACSLSRA